jgi:phosphatidylglycerophosphate synthase
MARILPADELADQLTLVRIAAVPVVVVLFVWDFNGHY